MLARPVPVLAVAVIAVLVACSPAPRPTPSPGPSAMTPTPASSTGSGPTQEPPSAVTSEPPGTADQPLAWIPLGTLEEMSWVDGIMATDDGYIVRGGTGEDADPAVWFSVDGRAWVRTDLWDGPRPCGVYPYVTLGAASSSGAVLMGVEQEGLGACIGHVASWFSADGRTWIRSADFGAGPTIDSSPVRLWPTSLGWEAIIRDADGRASIWTSPDGVTWRRGVDVPIGELDTLGAAAIDRVGTRVISVTVGDVDPPFSVLHSSPNGRDWQAAGAPRGTVTTLVPPAPDGTDWLAVTTDFSSDFMTSSTWLASDLLEWTGAEFPLGYLRNVIRTEQGLLALGGDACIVTGSPCDRPERPLAYLLSDDGLAWTQLDAAVGPELFSDGPAGLVGVDQRGMAWHLEPFTAEEASLLAGIRDDARVSCAPRREDLPPRAIAGVECAPVLPVVQSVGAYRFATAEDLLATYLERLAEEGIEPHSGSCPPGAGEGSYVPENPADAGLEPHRLGCFLNQFGFANIRSTVPEEHVYVGVLGRTGDIRALHDWVWLGNQDQPGSPTIWVAPPR